MSDVFKKFLKLEAASGIILIMAAVLAMILANSGLASGYQAFLDTPVQVRIAALDINKPLLLWINDGFMAIFFLLVGLEVKREMLEGALSSRVQATFPAIAAVGGMLAPALIYTFFNYSDEAARAGWAIPAATDIAFALGVMALLGKRVPVSLKVFLLALAIMDDLGVIIIIALFYTQQLSLEALAVGILATLTLLWMNRRGEDRIGLYMLVGLVLWVAVLKSGVHATLAGVVVGFMIPLNGKRYASPLKHLEHALHPWSAYLILPLFAFANAGVSLDGIGLSSLLSPVPMGIMLGLFVGKPLGYSPSAGCRSNWALLNCRAGSTSSRFLPSAFCVVSVLPCRCSLHRWRSSMADWITAAIHVSGSWWGPRWRQSSVISPCGCRFPTGKRIKARRGYEKIWVVNDTDESGCLGRQSGGLQAGCSIGELLCLFERCGRQRAHVGRQAGQGQVW